MLVGWFRACEGGFCWGRKRVVGVEGWGIEGVVAVSSAGRISLLVELWLRVEARGRVRGREAGDRSLQ